MGLLLLQPTSLILLQKEKLLIMDQSWGPPGRRLVLLSVSCLLVSLSFSGVVSASAEETIGLGSNLALTSSDNATEAVTEEARGIVYTEVMEYLESMLRKVF